jgi:hypothetical protein
MPFLLIPLNFIYTVEGGKVRGEAVYVAVDSMLFLISVTHVLKCRV